LFTQLQAQFEYVCVLPTESKPLLCTDVLLVRGPTRNTTKGWTSDIPYTMLNFRRRI